MTTSTLNLEAGQPNPTPIPADEQDDFEADLAYLQGYGAALIEHAGHRLPGPADLSVLEKLLDETPMNVVFSLMSFMSPAAREAMLWPVI